MSSWKDVSVPLLAVLGLVALARHLIYARKFDRELERKYPDTVAQLKANYPSLSWSKGIAIGPLFGASLLETSIVRDNELRRLRRKAIFSFVYVFLFWGLAGLIDSWVK